MNETPVKLENFFRTACIFEASLIIVAIFLGWIASINPFANLFWSEKAVFLGVVGTLPLFILFLALQHIQIAEIQKIRQLLLETLGPSLKDYQWSDLFVLAAIAGFSEEVLFRGVLQPWMEESWGMNAGLILSSIVFGLVHAVTPLYAVIATLVGIYLGLSLDYGGERNLWVPVIIHALYDFLAFIALMKAYKSQLSEKSNLHE